MKRATAAALAALLLLSLSACKQEPAPDPAPEPPAVVEPVQPATPEPEPQPEPTPDPEPAEPTPASGQVVVTPLELPGSVEESVSYIIRVPQVEMEPASAAQAINDYYTSVAGKMGDLAWGEVFEAALSQHTVLNLDVGFDVACNQDDRLSIVRTVAIVDQSTGYVDATLAAETFNLKNGGLLTLDDIFTVSAEKYSARLIEAVWRQIENDPYHSDNYYDSWQSLVESTFDKTRFYVTPDGLCVYFPQGDLGPSARTEFLIEWSSLTDLLP